MTGNAVKLMTRTIICCMSRIKWRIGTKNVVSLVEIKDAYCISIQSIIWVLLQLQPDFNDNATVTLNGTFFIHSKCTHTNKVWH